MNDTVTFILSGDVTLDDFSIAVSRLWGLVSALSKEVATKVEIEWIIDELSAGSTSTTIRGIGLQEGVGSVVEAYEKVGRALERDETIPFSSTVISEAYGLVGILNEKVESIRFETDNMEALIQRRAPIEAVEPIYPIEAYGAVEGRIQTLSSRRGLKFTLYDILNDKAVSCYLAPDQEEIMRDAWGKLALVEGWVRRDPVSGRPLTIRKVRNVVVLSGGEGGDYRQARGILPSSSLELPENVIRRLRDG